jgi:hypothetical protein
LPIELSWILCRVQRRSNVQSSEYTFPFMLLCISPQETIRHLNSCCSQRYSSIVRWAFDHLFTFPFTIGLPSAVSRHLSPCSS